MIPQIIFRMKLQSAVLALTALLAIPSQCDVFAAVGIAVSDLSKSHDFYTKSLGLVQSGKQLDTSEFVEVILKLPGKSTGAAVVLMKWKTPKQTANLPVKLVFYVESVKTTIDKMRGLGAKIVAEPGTLKIRNTTLPTAFALDPDGYSVEINPITALGAAI